MTVWVGYPGKWGWDWRCFPVFAEPRSQKGVPGPNPFFEIGSGVILPICRQAEVVPNHHTFLDWFEVVKIYATEYAFAAILCDNSVVTWGNPACGGDKGSLDLQEVKSIAGTARAFAALKVDGTVVTWGNEHLGCFALLFFCYKFFSVFLAYGKIDLFRRTKCTSEISVPN